MSPMTTNLLSRASWVDNLCRSPNRRFKALACSARTLFLLQARCALPKAASTARYAFSPSYFCLSDMVVVVLSPRSIPTWPGPQAALAVTSTQTLIYQWPWAFCARDPHFMKPGTGLLSQTLNWWARCRNPLPDARILVALKGTQPSERFFRKRKRRCVNCALDLPYCWPTSCTQSDDRPSFLPTPAVSPLKS
jgi:hypothetical protein